MKADIDVGRAESAVDARHGRHPRRTATDADFAPMTGRCCWVGRHPAGARPISWSCSTPPSPMSRCPNIAGGLAVSPSQGTWVITSYAVAEAITVPLTGWLAQRFGAVRVFIVGDGRLRRLLGPVRPGAVAGHAGGVPRAAGPVRRADDAAVPDPAAADLPAAAAGRWPWACGHDHGRRARSPGRSWAASSGRQRRLAVDVLHQCAGGAGLRLLRLAHAVQPRDPDPARARGHRRPRPADPLVGAMQIMLDKGKELDWFQSPIIVSPGHASRRSASPPS